MKLTRRVAIQAGAGATLSALGLSAFEASELTPNLKEGNKPMSHHLDTPLAAQNGQLYIDDLYVFSGRRQHGIRHGRQLEYHRSPCKAGVPP